MSHQDLPVSMHPRYSEFLSFMANCPYRKTPETMQTAFWAWLETNESQEWFAARPDPRDEQIAMLKRDLDRKHRECAERERQALVMSEEIIRLEESIAHIKSALDFGAIGERGHACMSVDGGNL